MVGFRKFMKQVAQHYLTDPSSFRATLAARDDNHDLQVMGGLWARYGMQSIQMPHTYAAALMATDCGTELIEHIHLPWPAFELVVPGGIVTTDSWGCAEAIYFASHRSECVAVFGFEKGSAFTRTNTLGELIELVSAELDQDSPEARALLLLKRFFVSTIVDVNTLPSLGRGSGSLSARRDHRDVPVPTTWTVGKPLTLDCRDSIRSYLAGDRVDPKVTTLVRGHFKMQPHGPHSSLRRPTRIAPYFRGDGPLLVRPTFIGVSGGDA